MYLKKQIFLIDGLGALLSLSLLLALTLTIEGFFGVPRQALLALCLLPLVFSIYSLSCHFLKPLRWSLFLRVIAIANLFYCGLTLGLVIAYFESLTTLGLLYFVIEKAIVIPLAIVEWRLSRA
jgi:hypothetical protein